jgi:phage FluMu protein gp41
MATTKPKLLTRDDILSAEDRATEVVEVPEWGGAVTSRALSGTERDRFETESVSYGRTNQGGLQISGVQTNNLRAPLVALSRIDADAKRMFSDKDELALGDKSAAALNRVFEAAQRLSRISQRDVEVLTADLKGGPNGTSGTD